MGFFEMEKPCGWVILFLTAYTQAYWMKGDVSIPNCKPKVTEGSAKRKSGIHKKLVGINRPKMGFIPSP